MKKKTIDKIKKMVHGLTQIPSGTDGMLVPKYELINKLSELEEASKPKKKPKYVLVCYRVRKMEGWFKKTTIHVCSQIWDRFPIKNEISSQLYKIHPKCHIDVLAVTKIKKNWYDQIV